MPTERLAPIGRTALSGLGSGVVLITATIMIVVVGSSSIWAIGGAALGRLIRDERRRRVLNVSLAVLLVASVLLIWL